MPIDKFFSKERFKKAGVMYQGNCVRLRKIQWQRTCYPDRDPTAPEIITVGYLINQGRLKLMKNYKNLGPLTLEGAAKLLEAEGLTFPEESEASMLEASDLLISE